MTTVLDSERLKVDAECTTFEQRRGVSIKWTVEPPPGQLGGSEYITYLYCEDDPNKIGQSDLFSIYKWLERIGTIHIREATREADEDLEAEDEASYSVYFENGKKRIKETIKWELLIHPNREGRLLVRVTYSAERSSRIHTTWTSHFNSKCSMEIPRRDLSGMAENLRHLVLECCEGLRKHVENL